MAEIVIRTNHTGLAHFMCKNTTQLVYTPKRSRNAAEQRQTSWKKYDLKEDAISALGLPEGTKHKLIWSGEPSIREANIVITAKANVFTTEFSILVNPYGSRGDGASPRLFKSLMPEYTTSIRPRRLLMRIGERLRSIAVPLECSVPGRHFPLLSLLDCQQNRLALQSVLASTQTRSEDERDVPVKQGKQPPPSKAKLDGCSEDDCSSSGWESDETASSEEGDSPGSSMSEEPVTEYEKLTGKVLGSVLNSLNGMSVTINGDIYVKFMYPSA